MGMQQGRPDKWGPEDALDFSVPTLKMGRIVQGLLCQRNENSWRKSTRNSPRGLDRSLCSLQLLGINQGLPGKCTIEQGITGRLVWR